MFEIRPAVDTDLPAARQVLSLCPPPHRVIDDDDEKRTTLYVATAGSNLVGCAAFDRIAEGHGLIRSLAVLPGFRKQHIGRHLILRVLAHADETEIDHLFLLTDRAREYFGQLGFVSCSADCVPEPVRMAPRFRALHQPGAVLMQRIGERELCGEGSAPGKAATEAKRQFDAGFYCSESVLLAVGQELGIDSALLPAIATGFSSGVSRTWGTCGAVNGAVLGLNLAFGRRSPSDSVEANYAAVRTLIGEFAQTCGSTQCSELLACDLDTLEGQRIYKTHHLRTQCREYVGIAARLATRIIHDRRSED